jgi:probable aminopeptidase NPEPL1
MSSSARELRFVSGPPPGAAEADVLVIVGTKARLLGPAASALVPEGAVPRAVWEAMCSAEGDGGGSNTTWLPPVSEGGKPRKLTAAVLPSACSRHNCPAQPHALASLVGAALGSASASVALAVPREHAMASACAVARCLSLYNAKTTRKKTAAAAAAAPAPAPAVVVCGFLDVDGDDAGGEGVEALLPLLTAAADSVRLAARLVDTPPAEMTTTDFRREARAVAELLGPRVEYAEIVGEELRDRGFGGIWGVGKAAEEPPALVVLSFKPDPDAPDDDDDDAGAAADDNKSPVVLVGKGIIYDTGGLSLKISGSMCGMKMDCGGAAAMLGAFRAAVLAGGLRRPLHCVLCLAENAIGPAAFRNDDILHMHVVVVSLIHHSHHLSFSSFIVHSSFASSSSSHHHHHRHHHHHPDRKKIIY